MSWQKWGTIGFGIRVDDIKQENISFEKLLELCKLSEPMYDVFVRDIMNYAEKLCEEPVTDFEKAFVIASREEVSNFFYDGFIGDGEDRLSNYLQGVIADVEDICVEFADNYDCEKFLLLIPSYPWDEISEKEKHLTREAAREMFLKYVHIFTDEDIAVEERNIVNGG